LVLIIKPSEDISQLILNVWNKITTGNS